MTPTPTPQEMAEACKLASSTSRDRYGASPHEKHLDAAAAYIEQAAAREAKLLARIEKLERVREAARLGVSSVRGLISESRGVDGLHLNGDIAEWRELDRGGRYGEWLDGFNQLEDALAACEEGKEDRR